MSTPLQDCNEIIHKHGSDSAVGILAKALAVLIVTPSIREYLKDNDPKALLQVEKALRKVAGYE